ncbi:ATP-grasp domain-containing protein [Eggerthellaceae bacterium 24-137]
MCKKLLILGSDYGTREIAIEATRMGLHVITSDNTMSSPTKEASTEAWNISTADIDTLARKCIEEDIAGVTFGASDFNMTMCAQLCARAGLPQYSSDARAIEVARDKAKFRELCLKVDAPIAEGVTFSTQPTSQEIENIQFPVVIKPVDKSANRGMSYCSNSRELLAAFEKAQSISDKDYVVCERQLHGEEWVANYILEDGEARLIYFGKEYHQPGQNANMYSFICTTSNGLEQYLAEVNDKVKLVFKEAGFCNGIAWVETMRDKDGHFYLIEPAYRFSSETLYALHERVDGFNSVRWYIESALGVKHSAKSLPPDLVPGGKSCVGSYHLFTSDACEIASIEGLDVLSSMGNVFVDLPKGVGSKVAKGLNAGLVKIYGNNIEDLIGTLKRVNEVFSIKDARGQNIFIRFTDYDKLKTDFSANELYPQPLRTAQGKLPNPRV